MEWKIKIKIDKCDQVFNPELGEGVVGVFIAEIPDEEFKKVGIVGVIDSLMGSAKEFRDEMVKIEIIPMES